VGIALTMAGLLGAALISIIERKKSSPSAVK